MGRQVAVCYLPGLSFPHLRVHSVLQRWTPHHCLHTASTSILFKTHPSSSCPPIDTQHGSTQVPFTEALTILLLSSTACCLNFYDRMHLILFYIENLIALFSYPTPSWMYKLLQSWVLFITVVHILSKQIIEFNLAVYNPLCKTVMLVVFQFLSFEVLTALGKKKTNKTKHPLSPPVCSP